MTVRLTKWLKVMPGGCRLTIVGTDRERSVIPRRGLPLEAYESRAF